MADKPSKRQRRQHLKNVRRVSRGQGTGRRKQANAQAASISGSGILLNLGLLVTSAILILFLVSAFFQYGYNSGSASTPESAPSPARNSAALPAVERSTIEVRVLNGCGTPGASRQMTTRLRDLGFDVVVADNAEHFGYTQTLVIDHTDRPEVGRAVAGAIGCKQLSAQQDEMALAHVTVILGKDWEKYLDKPSPEPQQEQGWIDQLNGKVRQLLEE